MDKEIANGVPTLRRAIGNVAHTQTVAGNKRRREHYSNYSIFFTFASCLFVARLDRRVPPSLEAGHIPTPPPRLHCFS